MYKRGDIVLVNLNPQRNNEVGKIRPCVIISDSDVNNILDLITIVPCSTNLLGEGLFRVPLAKRKGLDKECEVMIEQLRGVSKKRVLETISSVNKKEIEKIEIGVKALLAF
jgi:mRNA interferase MazF